LLLFSKRSACSFLKKEKQKTFILFVLFDVPEGQAHQEIQFR
jgi:hypothetical protein